MNHRPFKIFIIEDNEWYRKLLIHTLSLNPDYEIESFKDGSEFLSQLYREPDVVTLDYRLPDTNGAELLQKIKTFNEDTEVIIISEQENIETAVELLKLGAYDYIVKSNDIKERLLNIVKNIQNNASLKQKVKNLQQEIEQKYDFQKTIIGQSTHLKKIFALIEKAVQTNITVSISGETGTGKELVAKAIHYHSKNRNHPFVALNVAAIPKEMVESELFGHEKGAFTGAVFKRTGKFEEANNGTLFLDEIGEMDLTLQTKLLRALQEKEVTPVGSNKIVKTDCRIIIATHKNLKDEVKKGNFREDLYYRLLGLPIDLPPLRERDNDVLILAAYFMQLFCSANSIPEKKFSAAAQKKLLSYSFPGNIRELKSVVDLAIVMSNEAEILPDDIILGNEDVLSELIGEELSLQDYTQRIIKTFLRKYDNNINLVAQKLDISPSTIYRMLKESKS
ncbi:MAG: sigma-54 dependent transcriptional regulator [Bacteroidota bacterium]|nr:sigma-54 dependent transcriptional regulator [Bacteroidota bacterium]